MNKRLERGKPIVCARCGAAGGILIKREDGSYIHQDTAKCNMLRLRVKK